MSDTDKLISVEYAEKDEKVELFLNRRGAEDLIQRLQEILEGPVEHYHWMSKDWGGEELSNDQQGLNNKLIHHLQVWLLD